MLGAKLLVASKGGAAVADGREMRATADDQRLTGKPRAIVKKKKKISRSLNQSNFLSSVPYRNQRQRLYALRI